MLAVSFMSPLFPGKRSEEEEGRERRGEKYTMGSVAAASVFK
jgi:hypothetical protein